jgi:rhomboid-like protein
VGHFSIVISFLPLTCGFTGSSASHFLSKQQENGSSGLQESTATYHFLAFYLSGISYLPSPSFIYIHICTAGLFSSLVSHIVTARILFPRLVAKLASTPVASASTTATTARGFNTKAASEILPSLGASGAIYSTLMVSAMAFPALHVTLIIPPWFTIPIQWGVGGVVLMDCVGALRGWR